MRKVIQLPYRYTWNNLYFTFTLHGTAVLYILYILNMSYFSVTLETEFRQK